MSVTTIFVYLCVGFVGGFAGHVWHGLSNSKVQSVFVTLGVSALAAAILDLVFGIRP